MAYFALEIGTEEMPARFLPILEQALKDNFTHVLQDNMLGVQSMTVCSTPRRLLVLIPDLADEQPVEEILVSGPPAAIAYDSDGALTKAGLGFARSQGLDPENLFVRSTDKGDYLAARKKTGGKPAIQVLPAVCIKCLTGLPFPKKMHWSGDGFHFGRPIRWILALLDKDVVPFDLAGLPSDRLTMGHRVHGPGPWTVEHAENLLYILHDKGHIIADRSHRLRIIREKGDDSSRTAGGKVIWSQGLLQQVADLVEWPTPMLGRFDPSFLELPKEVLLTSMEVHQKSFGLEGDDGNLLPAFLTVANIEPKNFETVRHGWEKVLRARLEDAEFFWQADNKSGFDHWLKALENVVFLGPLGSMGDKSRRLERLAALVAKEINPEMEKDMARAGRLAKADLVTQMVGEFDDLQGIMGGIYARRMNESENVAQALYEQYLPAGQDTPVPSSMAGAVLALCDRADNLTGCFGLGMAPTGAADPYALRRQALGLCRILLEHDLNLDLNRLLKTALAGFVNVQWKLNPATIVPTVMDFIGQRLKSLWSAQGMDSRLLEACIRSGLGDLPDLRVRIAALEEFSQAPDFEEAVLTFKRADNIIRKQGEASGAVLSGRFSRDLLTEKAEGQLAAALEEMEKSWNQTMSSKGYAGLFQLLRDLRPVVDDFFDQVMVMCEDEKLRENRLNLLQALVERLSGLADFSALQI